MGTKVVNGNADPQRGKEAAGRAAAKRVVSGQLVGLGTGSTVAFFLEALAKRCRDEGLQINAVASSAGTFELASRLGIPLLDMDEVTFVDITIDGADEIDDEKRMIKGGGGALVREKIIASSSQEMVVIVDASKCVPKLGKFPLPVEIVRFGAAATLSKLERLGYGGGLRMDKSGTPFVTDNGNFIFDIRLAGIKTEPQDIDQSIQSVVGVVDTGFFFNMATQVLVGHADGLVEVRE